MEVIKIPVMPENPLPAQAYVPYQTWPEQLYDLDKGLSAGTVFPALDQPASWYEQEDDDE
ncbi:MAG: spore coat associated protein CotJA [Clostridiales bacterium]|jgi:hypothetical protein|nr:spore coat associated protein CotJA [Clostridiales bacterium]